MDQKVGIKNSQGTKSLVKEIVRSQPGVIRIFPLSLAVLLHPWQGQL